MNIKEIRIMDCMDFRRVLIREDWCTKCDNEEYGVLLDYVLTTRIMTTETLYYIATEVYRYSDFSGDKGEHILNIMYVLANDACRVVFYDEEEGNFY